MLLDARKDQYYFIGEEELRFLASKIAIYLPAEWSERQIESSESSNDIVKQLVEAEVLTKNPEKGHWIIMPEKDEVDSFFENLEIDDGIKPLYHHYLAAFFSGVYIYIILRIMPFYKILRWLQKRNSANCREKEKALKIGRIYRYLRPVLPKSRICLYDSLVFAQFARFYNVNPEIVFGVVSSPFEAHAWAKVGNTILNDTPQNISKYTPILIIG